jgi:hypothetical protein
MSSIGLRASAERESALSEPASQPEDRPPGVSTSRNVFRSGCPPESISGKYVDSIVADRTAHDESAAAPVSQR